MDNLDIDTDVMEKELTTLSTSLDAKDSFDKPYTSVSLSNCSDVDGISGINTKINEYVSLVNSSISSAHDSIDELLSKSRNFLVKITEANDEPLSPSDISNTLPEKLETVKSSDPSKTTTYPGGKPTNGDLKYFGDALLGVLHLGKRQSSTVVNVKVGKKNGKTQYKNFGQPQGIAQVIIDGEPCTVVTSYTKGNCGHIRIYDSRGKLKTYFNTDNASHMGGVVYQNGNLVIADEGGLTWYNLDSIMSQEGRTIHCVSDPKQEGYNHVSIDWGNDSPNADGSVSYVADDLLGGVVIGQFHTSNGSYTSNPDLKTPSSGLQHYTWDENGNLVLNNDAGNQVVEAIDGRSNSNSSVNGFNELQGLCVYKNSLSEEMTIFSSSFYANTSNNPSTLMLANHGTNEDYNFHVNDDGELVSDLACKLNVPPGVEQITRLADGNFALVFEGKNPRVVYVSADYFSQYLTSDDSSLCSTWTNDDQSKSEIMINGELYIGNLAQPLDKLATMETAIAELITDYTAASDSIGDDLQISQTGTIDNNLSTVGKEISVLSDAITDIKSKIIMVIENHRKTDEEI